MYPLGTYFSFFEFGRKGCARGGVRGGGGYSLYVTETSLQKRLVWWNIITKTLMSFAFEKTPRISLNCKLVPVQYREYDYHHKST